MSNRITHLCRDLVMTVPRKFTLMCLADRADNATGSVPGRFAAVPSICRWTCLSRTSVIDAVNWLADAGLIAVVKQVGKRWQIRFNEDALKAAQPVQEADGLADDEDDEPVQVADGSPVQEADGSKRETSARPVRQADHTRPAGGRVPVQEADTTRPPGVPPIHHVHQERSIKGPSGERARDTRLPTDWTLPDDWRQYCVDKRPDLEPDAVAENFRDYWLGKAGSDGLKRNWPATWQRWVRNERGPANQQESPASAASRRRVESMVPGLAAKVQAERNAEAKRLLRFGEDPSTSPLDLFGTKPAALPLVDRVEGDDDGA